MVKRISLESRSKEVDAYIAGCPKDFQGKLRMIRAAIREAAPGARETTSYFHMPGYFYPGYDYNGMFAWFGLKKSHLALLLRPPTINDHKKELAGYGTTKSAVHFPLDQEVPVPLVRKLVKASIKIMKDKPKEATPSKPRT
ncbi:MAG: iron chaperone [Rhabdochlamydiaceae bacterium]